jgi:hypothetical protein
LELDSTANTSPDPGTGDAAEDAGEDIRQRIAGTNINVETMLATDYLNHFNEVVMLLEMIPDMPDCFDELKDWRPKSYKEHFQDSVFSDRELAVEAYDHAPIQYRDPFEAIIGCLDEDLLCAIGAVEAAIDDGTEGRLVAVVGASLPEIQSLLDKASAIINGVVASTDQSDIDKILES